jgi:hypothetical protein
LILKKNKLKQFLLCRARPEVAGLDGGMIAQMFGVRERRIWR